MDVNLHGLSHAAFQPLITSVQYFGIFPVKLVASLFNMCADSRVLGAWSAMLRYPCLKASRCLPHIVGLAPLTFHVVNHVAFG